MKKIIQIVWGVFLFAFPFSVRFVVYEQASYRFGNFNPWVTGFVYLPEVLLGIIFILWIIQKAVSGQRPARLWRSGGSAVSKFHWLFVFLFLFLLNVGIVSFWKGDPVLFGFFLLRIAEAVIIYLLVADQLLPIKTVVTILISGAGFQLALGYLQWYLNHSLGLRWIGEQAISSDILGVAKNDLAEGVKQIRPYGTFLHPNVLAAYLMVILFISLNYLRGSKLVFWLVVLTAGIWFTGSRAAALATIICFVLLVIFAYIRNFDKRRRLILALFALFLLGNAYVFTQSQTFTVSDVSWQERIEQNVISKSMLAAHPLGVGVSNFTLEMENFASRKMMPWEFQPVHNTYFLVMNEVGIQGLLIMLAAIILYFWKYWKGQYMLPLMALILVAPLDHYLWDSFVGVMIIGLVVAFTGLKTET